MHRARTAHCPHRDGTCKGLFDWQQNEPVNPIVEPTALLGTDLTLTSLGSVRSIACDDRLFQPPVRRGGVDGTPRSSGAPDGDRWGGRKGSKICPVSPSSEPRHSTPKNRAAHSGPGRDRRHCRLPGAQRSRAGTRRCWGWRLLQLPGHIADQWLDQRREPHRIGPGFDEVRTTGFRGASATRADRQER